jgi:SAM-dependent methyltransferase
VAGSYDALADRYDDLYGDNLARAEDDFVFDLLARRGVIDPDAVVLDVGCGTGLFVDRHPFPSTSHYLGVDVSPGMLERAAAKHPHMAPSFRVADACNMTQTIRWWRDAHTLVHRRRWTVDHVVCLYAVVNYLDDPVAMLRSAASFTRPGGTLTVMFHAPPAATKPRYALDMAGVADPPRHFYDRERIRALFRRAPAWALTDMIPFQFALDRVPGAARLPVRALRAAIGAESALLRFAPDRAYYLIATANRQKGHAA